MACSGSFSQSSGRPQMVGVVSGEWLHIRRKECLFPIGVDGLLGLLLKRRRGEVDAARCQHIVQVDLLQLVQFLRRLIFTRKEINQLSASQLALLGRACRLLKDSLLVWCGIS